jgi:hypothetical protein
MLLPAIGWQRCYRCRRPWWAISDTHDVEYAPGRGQFALCEPCWARSTRDMRWAAHAWVCSGPSWTVEETWTILRAIEEDTR